MATHFITFGGGKKQYVKAVVRIVHQAGQFECIDTQRGFLPHELDAGYYDLFPDFPKRYPRGFGLWSWKPYLILNTLKSLHEGDFLIYADSGCEMNHLGEPKLRTFLALAETDGIFIGRTPFAHREWSKKDPLLLPNDHVATAGQVEATWMILHNTKAMRDFIGAWLDLCAFDGGRLLVDPEADTQDPWFNDHRHDQSCLHVIAEKWGIPTKSERSFFKQDWKGDVKATAKSYPLIAVRNRHGRSAVPWLRKNFLF